MNLYLTASCNERCAFCYAGRMLNRATASVEFDCRTILESVRQYADLLHRSDPPPAYDPDADEETRSLYSARTVNLLGGEPTLHPDFERIVGELADLGLGVMVFTNGSLPGKTNIVRDKIWCVVLNGHFASRAAQLRIEPHRIHAHLPIQPGLDIRVALERIHAAGIRTLYLAFATPAGGNSHYFTPNDVNEMRRLHGLASAFCRENRIAVGYQCAFPTCVDTDIQPTSCISVPVMTADGYISICGGEYLHEKGKRHISTFDDYRQIHAYAYQLLIRMRDLPSRFDVCNECPYFGRQCQGMCLAFREQPASRELSCTAFSEGQSAAFHDVGESS